MFITLAQPHRYQQQVKGSEFIACAYRVDSPEQALLHVHNLKTEYPEASHVCWAYKIAHLYRFADDGEPAGTAGQPILRAIEGQGLEHVLVAVVRYFGGTKLGAGGLMRAYSGSAAEVLRLAPKHQELPKELLQCEVPFEYVSGLYHVLGQYSVWNKSEHYTPEGLVVQCQVLLSDIERVKQELQDMSRGKVRLISSK